MTILGMSICISVKSMEKAMDTVETLTPRRTHIPIATSIERINRWYVGWSAYYKMTEYPSQLSKIESHIRRRLRATIIGQKKRNKNIYSFFTSNGVKPKTAWKAVTSNNGIWAMSFTPAAHLAMPNHWFKSHLGLKTTSDKDYPHWNNIKEWPSLL